MRSFFNLDEGYPFTGTRGAFVPPPADYVDVRNLAPDVVKVHAVPAGARLVVFSATAEFWARFGTSTVSTAAPASDVVDGSAPELNPAARFIPAGVTHIALSSPDGAQVTLAFYAA